MPCILFLPLAAHGAPFIDGVTASDQALCSNSPAITAPNEVDPATLPDSGTAWNVGTNRWSTEAEESYGEWVRTQVGSDFLVKYKIAADCTDTALSIRLVYARLHHLPVWLSDGQTSLAQSSVRFKSLPTVLNWNENDFASDIDHDLRFRAFLKAAEDLINAYDLANHTYPVALEDPANPGKLSQWVRPGTLMLELTHTRFISHIDPKLWNPIQELWGTWGEGGAKVIESGIASWQYGDGFPQQMGRGVVNWRWPVFCGTQSAQGGWKLAARNTMPGYSQAQYQWTEWNKSNPLLAIEKQKRDALDTAKKNYAHDPNGLYNWLWLWTAQSEWDGIEKSIQYWKDHPSAVQPANFSEVYQALARDSSNAQPDEAFFASVIDRLKGRLMDRIPLVLTAAEMLKTNPHVFDNTGSSAYEDFSTPGRDAADRGAFEELQRLADRFGTRGGLDSTWLQERLSEQQIEIAPSQMLGMNQYWNSMRAGQVSSDPRDTFERRWGIQSR